MIRRLIRRIFGRTETPAIRPEDDDDPYMGIILSEVFRTGGMVIGNVADNGDLILSYQDGSTARVPRNTLTRPPPPDGDADATA